MELNRTYNNNVKYIHLNNNRRLKLESRKWTLNQYRNNNNCEEKIIEKQFTFTQY